MIPMAVEALLPSENGSRRIPASEISPTAAATPDGREDDDRETDPVGRSASAGEQVSDRSAISADSADQGIESIARDPGRPDAAGTEPCVEFLWDEDRPPRDNFDELGARLAVRGDLFRSSAPGGG